MPGRGLKPSVKDEPQARTQTLEIGNGKGVRSKGFNGKKINGKTTEMSSDIPLFNDNIIYEK